jgi:hypothetical protein
LKEKFSYQTEHEHDRTEYSEEYSDHEEGTVRKRTPE